MGKIYKYKHIYILIFRIMTTKLLPEPTGAYELTADTGKFELPQAANDNYSPVVKMALEGFKEKLLTTTILTPLDSQQKVFKNRALAVLNVSELGKLSPEEETTAKLAIFFGKNPAEIIKKDRLEAANDNKSNIVYVDVEQTRAPRNLPIAELVKQQDLQFAA